jgi:putative phosphoribosyl transferase
MLDRPGERAQREWRGRADGMIGPMRFHDRADAGERLAEALSGRLSGPAVVLGVPRGGVLVAAPVAHALGAPLDVVVPKKVGAPGNPELGLGAVAPGVRVLDDRLIRKLGVDDAYLEAEIARAESEIARRTAAYRAGSEGADLTGKTAIVVDDGVATGGTAYAAIAWARASGAANVTFAAPVSPPDTADRIAAVSDDAVFLITPSVFFAVGEWYETFEQVSDEEVRATLRMRE